MSQHGAIDDDMPENGEAQEPAAQEAAAQEAAAQEAAAQEAAAQEAGAAQDALLRRQSALEAAAAGWVRRGYVVRYQDHLLLQLIRRERPGWRALGWLALALGTGAAAVLLALGALRGRQWHVVTLALRPDGRVIMHSQRAPRPPSP